MSQAAVPPYAATLVEAPRPRRRLPLSRSGAAGLTLVALVVTVAVLAPLITPYGPAETDLARSLRPPSRAHPMGTDQLGRDLLTRIVYGARVSLAIGLVTVGVSGAIGLVVGLIAGYLGGAADAVLMRVVDVWLAFPFILLALTVNAILGIGLQNIILTLIITGWVVYARLVRGEVLALRALEYVEAARALGAREGRIIARHLLPNLWTPVIILSSLQVAQFIVAEAAISFLGFGVQPPMASWGNMLNEGKTYIYNAWWMTTFPGVALVLTALGVNLVGDWLRDTLDPRLTT
ncbi:MAG: ABC transporter permease [Armatimonadota bacterium]|nr:ABC transporter permease [Armatimonadota bacterium]MDR7420957.1 ABC transporter permease [Armatimonadota bacterium]MDR7457652.1 ABC transporter permease [Armatimonadota bacterium]MDR7497879.1 ABC transporter permease [Armatimonadota bacterium]MDR7512161.1 ABC transporter permease [Armatimonadota bacterium]